MRRIAQSKTTQAVYTDWIMKKHSTRPHQQKRPLPEQKEINTMSINQMTRIEKMLEAILKSENNIHWVGAYAHGRTKDGEPYLILFPANEKLEHKVCRVYQSHFKKLPSFVDTAVPANVRKSKNAPGREKGISCPMFQVITYSGRETQMGPEKRFADVIAISGQQAAVAPKPRETAVTTKPKQTAVNKKSLHDWLDEAASAQLASIFDNAIAKAEPWLKDASAARQFREVIFGDWNAKESVAVCTGLTAYVNFRKKNSTHNQAKEKALQAYKKELAAIAA